MSKLLVVFGATGQQGGSIANAVIANPELSKQYKVRAVTRDPSKPAAQSLEQKGAEVVKGDADDAESLKAVMQGAHTVFGVTTTVYDDQLKEREMRQGKAMADAAVAAGASYFIWSTLAHIGKVAGGKLQHGEHFDVKAEVEEYIRTLPIKSAFFAPGSFMQNFHQNSPPMPLGDGTFALFNFIEPSTLFPLIDTVDDSGKYVGAILAEPEKYEGKVFSAATALLSYEEIAQVMTKVSGKTVKYQQLPQDVWMGFLPPPLALRLADMYILIQDYGYYGPGTKEAVEWTSKQARGKLTTFEEYLKKNPLRLE